jgi:hypothetical protein
MSNSIIPESHENRLAFFVAIKDWIDTQATGVLGWSAAQVTAADATLAPIIAKYQALVDADAAVLVAVADADQVFTASKAAVQSLFDQMKANPAFTAGMEEELKLVSTFTKPAPADMQPRIKATAQPGSVQIAGSKDYADLVNIYLRLLGETTWRLVGIRRRRFPFDDQTPLKVAGTPEQREYMARCVVGEDEVGHPSDIVSVTYGG